ncbi:unnamed protein product [Adineta ricciae]|uniref:Uncharacterized protein n=1 Tax=Adineta ricciae TaxID=249248 RepID=A0A816FCU9_ADIRI|nr:unnamed protein product [Adineta ricciae]
MTNISVAIIETTLPSSFNLNLNVHDFYDEELLDKEISLCLNRYEHIETFHWKNIYKIKIDDIPTFFFSEWRCIQPYSNAKCANLRLTSIELPCLSKSAIHSNYPDVFKGIFQRLFPNVKHIVMNQAEISVCSQFNKYTLPWKTLPSLKIKCFDAADTNEDENIRNRKKNSSMKFYIE